MKENKKQETLEVKESPERAIQSLFSVVIKNHIHLSRIADKKANLILVICSLLLSIILTNSYRYIVQDDSNSNSVLWIPTAIFIAFMLMTIVLSIITTIPSVTKNRLTKEEIVAKKINLAFFGNFYHMPLDNYEWAVKETFKDNTTIYTNLTKDLYFLGIVLNKKFKLLNVTYNLFIIGLIVSAIAFAIVLKFF
ncbi:Pycsar system effector family protein [Lacinutrix sp. Hel_I_90]|uniref:Pycsar system effector family protein n=1 Tax=Lacinutrix sp. Hel_I_90 TaxID=1249999 RepID=UPI000697BA3F|nr:Pycsar system effector family protein [Lacinutrix sp. Hel_I_90]